MEACDPAVGCEVTEQEGSSTDVVDEHGVSHQSRADAGRSAPGTVTRPPSARPSSPQRPRVDPLVRPIGVVLLAAATAAPAHSP